MVRWDKVVVALVLALIPNQMQCLISCMSQIQPNTAPVVPACHPHKGDSEKQSPTPCSPDARLTSWKEYQSRAATDEEIKRWLKSEPPAWAVVTGVVSGIVTLDFDGEQGRRTMQGLGISPHRKTPSGGFHADFRHPGWYVPTLNSKTKRELGQQWPGLDIRGDGGYAIYTGRNASGPYEQLSSMPAHELETLPVDLRMFLGLLPPVHRAETSGPAPTHNIQQGERVSVELLIKRALGRVGSEGRNNAGTWLATQLRDNCYSLSEAKLGMRNFRAHTPQTNTKGQREPYTEQDAFRTVESIYSRPAREPWKQKSSRRRAAIAAGIAGCSGDVSISAENGLAHHQPYLFRITQSGVYRIDKDGQAKDRWICPPLEVVARARAFNGYGYGKLLRFRDQDDQERQWIIPHSALIGDTREPLERLLDMGFKPSRARKDLDALKDYIYQTEPQAAVRCVSSVGWHNDFFVLPNKSFGPTESQEEVLFSSDVAIDHKYKVSGSLKDWQRQVSRLCLGNSRLLFAVSCAFAAPLLELVKADNGGFHFRGVSSCGKTTALLAAGSVWGGNSQTGFLQTWRATSNGIEARAAMHNDALLCLDEISEVGEKEIGEIVYTLGNGAGKGRMTRHITSRLTTQFKLVFLSAGERTLSDIMQSVGKQSKGGQEARLIEIPAETDRGWGLFENLHEHATADAFARNLSQAAKTYFGSPIQEYLEHVTATANDVGHDARRQREAFLRTHVPMDASGEVSRVASLFGLVAAGGEIATAFGITGWSGGDATRAAETCFKSWIENRGGTGAHDVDAGIHAVRAFLERYGGARFENLESPSQVTPHDRAGYRDADAYYIFPEVFHKEVCKGYDYREIATVLNQRGHLKRHEGEKNLAMQKYIPSLKTKARFYTVRLSIFGAEVENSSDSSRESGENREEVGFSDAGQQHSSPDVFPTAKTTGREVGKNGFPH